jgi:hypothetical protein
VSFDLISNSIIDISSIFISAADPTSNVNEVVSPGLNSVFSLTFGNSLRTALSNGYRFVLSRMGGWTGPSIVLTVNATDASGSTVTVLQTGTVTETVAPDVLFVDAFIPNPIVLGG